MRETFYEKICRYNKLFEEKNVEFLKHIFENYNDYKNELNVKENEVKAKNLIVFTAVKDYEKKFDFQIV